MAYMLAVFVFITLAMAAMAVGVIFSNHGIRRSSGGCTALDGRGGKSTCGCGARLGSCRMQIQPLPPSGDETDDGSSK